jgi:3-dehydroshikimate dehydratase
MIRLSAFADEISPRLTEQLDVLESEGIRFLDLRSVDDTNVLDLTDVQVREIQQELGRRGVRVAAIGSPLAKVPIESTPDRDLAKLERAIELAHTFATPYIRVFSFYPPAGEATWNDPGVEDRFRDAVLERLRVMVEHARGRDVVLLHENDTGLYGDTIPRCLDVQRNVAASHFRNVFDPSNYVLSRQVVYPDAYEAVQPWIEYVHVKDARDGTVLPAGQGDANWPSLLRRMHADGYSGYFALEPHLGEALWNRGFSGPERFRAASQAFQGLLNEIGWEFE